MNKISPNCQAVTIGPKIYVMFGCSVSIPINSSGEVFEMPISSLYPTDANYVTVESGYRSPKLLENLCIDQICRSLPDLDGDIPPGKPQYIINAIVQSLVSRGAWNETTLKPFRHYNLDQLPLAGCRDESEEKLLSQSATLPGRECKRFKPNL